MSDAPDARGPSANGGSTPLGSGPSSAPSDDDRRPRMPASPSGDDGDATQRIHTQPAQPDSSDMTHRWGPEVGTQNAPAVPQSGSAQQAGAVGPNNPNGPIGQHDGRWENQPPQGAWGSGDYVAPLPHGAADPAHSAQVAHAGQYGQHDAAFSPSPSPSPSSSSSKGGLFAAAGTSALLAAALASAGTYAVAHHDSNGGDGTVSTGNTTVIKSDPKDFADAGTVNWSATAAKVNPSVVSITVTAGDSGGEGSGVILDKQGNIVTNNHVVSSAGKGGDVSVTLSNNRTYEASIVGRDPSTDLAVIRIKDVPALTPVEMGDDTKLVVGQPVMAVGNPLGLAGTVTTGIVSALDRPVTTSEEEPGSSSSSAASSAVVTNAIQTSAAINPGNSGGALVNGSGKLIGINSSIASLSSSQSSSSQSGNIGIGFAIPTTVVKNIANQLIEKGKAQHALLGISTEATEVKNGNATLTAAKVSSVQAGSGAAKAGLKNDDAIISIDGEPETSANALVGQVRSRTVGSTVKLTVVRDGHERDVEVTLGAQPDSK